MVLNASVAPMEIAVQVVVAVATQIINKNFKLHFHFIIKERAHTLIGVGLFLFSLVIYTYN